MRVRTRPFAPHDADAAAALFADYMQETFACPNALTPDVLLRDGQGLRFHLMLAVGPDDRPVGFAAWRMTYDLHHAVAGGEIPDLFVARPMRGRALGVRLIAAGGAGGARCGRALRQGRGAAGRSRAAAAGAPHRGRLPGRERLCQRLRVSRPGRAGRCRHQDPGGAAAHRRHEPGAMTRRQYGYRNVAQSRSCLDESLELIEKGTVGECEK
jgi:GNAT superfamily N-acetyltransferase